MKTWYTNKYFVAAIRALAIGVVTAAVLYFTLLPDTTIDTRRLISLVALAGLAPFALLVKVLPDPLQVVQLVPGQVGERAMLVELPVVKGIITPVSVPPAPTAGTQPLPSFAATPKPRAPSGRFAGGGIVTQTPPGIGEA